MQQEPPQMPKSPLPAVFAMLSKPRMDAYRDFLKFQNEDHLLGFYLWAQALASAFSPLIGCVEIALRNKIHEALSLHHSLGTATSSAWYDPTKGSHTHLRGKSLFKVEEQLYNKQGSTNSADWLYLNPQPSPDKVISELSFGVWSDVLQQVSGVEAYEVFSHVFSNHPQNIKKKHWSYHPNRDAVIKVVKRVQAMRNRICHHEPVWKPHFLSLPKAPDWRYTVTGLRTIGHDFILLLEWMSPELHRIYMNSFGFDWFNKLCTHSAVFSFLANSSNSGKLEPIVDPRPPAQRGKSAPAVLPSASDSMPKKAVEPLPTPLGNIAAATKSPDTVAIAAASNTKDGQSLDTNSQV